MAFLSSFRWFYFIGYWSDKFVGLFFHSWHVRLPIACVYQHCHVNVTIKMDCPIEAIRKVHTIQSKSDLFTLYTYVQSRFFFRLRRLVDRFSVKASNFWSIDSIIRVGWSWFGLLTISTRWWQVTLLYILSNPHVIYITPEILIALAGHARTFTCQWRCEDFKCTVAQVAMPSEQHFRFVNLFKAFATNSNYRRLYIVNKFYTQEFYTSQVFLFASTTVCRFVCVISPNARFRKQSKCAGKLLWKMSPVRIKSMAKKHAHTHTKWAAKRKKKRSKFFAFSQHVINKPYTQCA